MKEFWISIKALIVFTVLTGLIYPVVVTVLANAAFKKEAQGSLLEVNGKVVGSKLIGQGFTEPQYFWSRPSATSPIPWDASNSNGSNLGPTNLDFLKTLRERVADFKKQNPGEPVPTNLMTASASGLDPDITLQSAEVQVARIARVRRVSPSVVEAVVTKYRKGRTFGFLGVPRVNVLEMNVELDKVARYRPQH